MHTVFIRKMGGWRGEIKEKKPKMNNFGDLKVFFSHSNAYRIPEVYTEESFLTQLHVQTA